MCIAKKIYRVYEKIRICKRLYAKDYYFADYKRVYPDGIAYYTFGIRRRGTKTDLLNFRNHLKFYQFAAQFVKGKKVADAGCGSGYGCDALSRAGAAQVFGMDASKKSVEFATLHYGTSAKFTRQTITDMNGYPDDLVDVSMSSEVLEHIKEYSMENKALLELKRITKRKGLIVVATPNAEMLHDHGFYYSEMKALFQKHFSKFCIFENALLPFGEAKEKWEKRLEQGEVGIVVSQNINLDETIVKKGWTPQIKHGIGPGKYKFADWEFDTNLLHNTHSWIVLAVNEK